MSGVTVPDYPAAIAKAVMAFNGQEEGGLSLNNADSGNWFSGQLIGSNRGISAPTLASWLRTNRPGVALTAAYMKALPEDVYQGVCRDLFWEPMGLSWIAPVSPGLALSCYDHGFNRGPHWGPSLVQAMIGMKPMDQNGRFSAPSITAYKNCSAAYIATACSAASVKLIQAIVGATIDGNYGPKTDAAVAAIGAKNVVALYALHDIQVHDYSTLKNFKANPGWIPRAQRRLARAITMETLNPTGVTS